MVPIATQLKRKGYPAHPSNFTVEGNERHVQLVSDSGLASRPLFAESSAHCRLCDTDKSISREKDTKMIVSE